MTWYDSDYGYKKKITLDNTKVAGDEIDFPVLVSVTDNDLRDEANGGHVKSANGYDIIFTNSAENTQLKHEIEKYVNTDGTVVYWVKVPSLSSTPPSTDIYIYYGKVGVGADPSTTNTWDNNFQAVWHMDFDAGIQDSTSNDNDMSRTGTVTTNTSGKIGDCQESVYNAGGANYIESDDAFFNENDTTFTWSYWIHGDNTAYNYGSMGTTNTNTYDGDMQNDYKGWLGMTGGWAYQACDDGAGNGVYLNSTVDGSADWQYYSFRRDGNDIYFYKNGVLVESGATTWTLAAYTKIMLMRYHAGGGAGSWQGSLDGKMDETRISTVTRSVNWELTSFESQNDPAAFMGWGVEEEKPIIPPTVGAGAVIYITENTNLVDDDYITINRGDIIAGFDPDPGAIVILRIVKHERDF